MQSTGQTAWKQDSSASETFETPTARVFPSCRSSARAPAIVGTEPLVCDDNDGALDLYVTVLDPRAAGKCSGSSPKCHLPDI